MYRVIQKQAVLAILLFLAAILAGAQSNQRFALVIGNGNYQYLDRLSNPPNDATDIAAALTALGYRTELKLNLGNADMGRAITDYIGRLGTNPSNEGFFWYAGHGVQIDGENYLLPVDINAKDNVDIEYGSFSVNRLIRTLDQNARNKVNVVVLDACRNNPFRNMSGSSRGLSRGLATVRELPSDLFMIFSTSAGDIAADGESGQRNSPFARAFLKHINSSDDLSIVVRSITRETLALTDNHQSPYHEGRIINLDYYSLNPRNSPPAPASTPQPVAPATGDAKASYDRGNAARTRRDFDTAIREYTEAIRINPNYAEAYIVRGNAYNDKRDYERAIADCTEAIRIDPTLGSAYIIRGVVYNNKRDYDQAIKDFTDGIRLNPNYSFAYVYRGRAYYNRSEYDRAIADYTEAIRLNPNEAEAYTGRGNAYKAKGAQTRADTDYAAARRLAP
ncbi:tetratricopeptide repeat protein [Treponema primitia]|uniref:caspase family protein n=1 Tax=Treponema primitia TaxID=88058 RepID=UPI00397FB17A